MWISRHRRRRTQLGRVHIAFHAAHDGILVVEHEFQGGPFDGRRMTGLACTDDMHVEHADAALTPRLVVFAAPARVGTYRFERAYDCARTVERVHAYRWHPSPAADGA